MAIRNITGIINNPVLGDLTATNRLSEEIEQELLFHIAERKDRLIESGLTEAEAELEARRLFGDFSSTREECLKSYNLGLRLAVQRFALLTGLIVVTTLVTLFAADRLRPVTTIDARLNAMFADLKSDNESYRRRAAMDALTLADASDLNSLREEIYARVSTLPIPEVVSHLQRVALNKNLNSELRLVAIDSLGNMAVENESVGAFLFTAAQSEDDPRICAALLDHVSKQLDLSTVQSLVCSPDISRAAKCWGLFELRLRCDKDYNSSVAWLGDSKVLEAAKKLLLTSQSTDEQVAIVKLFRQTKSPQVRDWLLEILNQPVDRSCLVHALFDLGQYVDDDEVAERLVSIAASNTDIEIQSHVKRSLALRK